MADNLHYSNAQFAATILRVMGTFAPLFVLMMIVSHYHFGTTLEQMNFPFSVPVFFYLTFILGWAFAYNKFYKFPGNQKVLLLGVMIGALIMPVLGGFSLFLFDQIEFPELLKRLPAGLLGTFVGAAMQLYFAVIVLRFFPWRFPF